MIDPRELRIDNIVNRLTGERVLVPSGQVRIAEIGFLGAAVYSINDHPAKVNWVLYDYQTLDPVPLTAEWLERFGFEDNRGFKSVRIALSPLGKWQRRTFLIVALQTDYANTEAWIDLITERGENDYPELQSMTIPCQYVHQLQNLYFALTGKELKQKKP